MSSHLNKVQLIGRLGNKPKILEGNGQTYASLSLAINEPVKKEDQWETTTQWYQLVLFGKLTKVCDFLDKGSLVFVEGKLRSRDWQDQEGNSKRQVNIVVHNVQILDTNKQEQKDEVNASDIADKHLNELKAFVENNVCTDDVPY